jgi:hypothetical protein
LLGVLIAAAIDAKREESARSRSEPILAATRDHDFRAEMAGALADESARSGRLALRTPWKVEAVDTESRRLDLLDASTDGALLYLRVDYHLEGGTLHVEARAHMVGKSPGLAAFRPAPADGKPLAPGNAIYLKSFAYRQQAVTAANAKAALSAGARSVAAQLVADLARDG